MDKVKWHRLNPLRNIPEWSDDGKYFSLYPPEPFKLRDGDSAIIPLGISADIPEGYQMLIRPVPKLINYGIDVWDTVIEKFDDLYHTSGKHQIHIGITIDQVHSYEFWPVDEIARGVSVKTPQLEFIDSTKFDEVPDEKAQEISEVVTGAVTHEDKDEQAPCEIGK